MSQGSGHGKHQRGSLRGQRGSLRVHRGSHRGHRGGYVGESGVITVDNESSSVSNLCPHLEYV